LAQELRTEKVWCAENKRERDRDVLGREKGASGSDNDS
jgi:hypothetical protein